MSFPSESIGELDRQDISFKVNGDGSHRRRWKVPFWPIGGKAHYWEYEFKPHENTGEITNIKNYFDNGNNKCSEITLKASGKYPFLPVAPEIDIESTIWACRCYNSKSSIPSGFATISEYVVHNSFPNYEASIDGSWIYSYDTTGTGPNPFNLGLNVVNASFGVSVIVD